MENKISPVIQPQIRGWAGVESKTVATEESQAKNKSLIAKGAGEWRRELHHVQNSRAMILVELYIDVNDPN